MNNLHNAFKMEMATQSFTTKLNPAVKSLKIGLLKTTGNSKKWNESQVLG